MKFFFYLKLNGVATEALLIREPNITHAKLVQIESASKVLVAMCKLIPGEANGPVNPSPSETPGTPPLSQPVQHQISIVNLANGECVHEILFKGTVLEMKSNGNLLCVSSRGRIDAFDLTTFEHRFSVDSCFPYTSKSTGRVSNSFALGHRWLAFADIKVSL